MESSIKSGFEESSAFASEGTGISSLTLSSTGHLDNHHSNVYNWLSSPTTKIGGGTGGGDNRSLGHNSYNTSHTTTSSRSSSTNISIENELQSTLIRGSEKESRGRALKRHSIKLNQLRHSNLRIHGRDNEIAILKDCLKNITVVVDSSSKNNNKKKKKEKMKIKNGDDDDEGNNKNIMETTVAVTKTTTTTNEGSSSSSENNNTTSTTTTKTNNNYTSSSGGHSRRLRRSRELIFLHGKSGTGKTALVNTTLRQKVSSQNGIFATGKFDKHTQNEPYTAVKEFCLEICGHILSLQNNKPGIYGGQKLYRDFQYQLLNELDNEQLQLLIRFVPDLTDIILVGNNNDNNNNRNPNSNSNSNNDIIDDEQLKILVDNNNNNNNNNSHGNDDDDDKQQQQQQQQGNNNQEFAKAQVNYSFRKFIRLVGSFFSPIVLVLDDLQWADDASLGLLQVLITDIENPGLMIVGMYRPSSDDEDGGGGGGGGQTTTTTTTLLSKTIQELESKQNEYEFNITNMTIQNLDVPDVNRVLMDLLYIDEYDKTLELAELCHRRTGGNAFFLLVFCDMLRAEELLNYNFGTMEWNWDVQEIESSTAATPNVVDIMKKNVAAVTTGNKDRGELMLLAACLGSHFNLKTLELLRGKRNDEGSGETVPIIMDWSKVVTELGFLEYSGSSGGIQWAHDNIRESVLSLVTREELLTTKQSIGTILAKELTETERDASIFVIVDLLNESVTALMKFDERVWLAELNLQATRKAISLSAFKSAARYAKTGIDLLPKDQCTLWVKTRELTVELFCYYADAMEVLGEHETIEYYCNEIIKQKDLSLAEKLRAYEILARYFSGSERPDQAVKVLRIVLKELGHQFPRNKSIRFAKMIPGLFRMKAILKPLTQESIRTMPLMTDPTHIQTMKLLDRLVFCSYMCTKIELFSLGVFRMIQMSLTHGFCEYSAVAFAYFGIILALMGDIAAGGKIGNDALALMSTLTKSRARPISSRVIFTVHIGILPRLIPARNSLKEMFKGYELGMATGDSDNATLCAFNYIALGFQAGRDLHQLEADCHNYSKQMSELKKELSFVSTKIFWQLIRNLIGPSENPTLLMGDVLDFDENYLENKQDLALLVTFRYAQSRLYCIFGEYERGANRALAHGDFLAKVSPASPLVLGDAFSRGVLLAAMARKTKERKYLKEVKKIRSTIFLWIKKDNPNVRHYMDFLDAELAALSGDIDTAETRFQTAIRMSSRFGFLSDAALISERYLILLVERENLRKEGPGRKSHSPPFSPSFDCQDEIRYRYEETLKYYAEWGATTKVERLRRKYQYLEAPESEICAY